ncbi:hypothetical protein AARAC_002800 [Aspergillus arachidicola]|uniref:Uncharacterized protein n=1 Tax=Aspergillus arachidicola TaxID=656916 RepID=A0A2G7FXT1_9EURO|nr:hypothetical protein AARAC_002800 [Aspergillus arachidicola]
MCFDSDFVPPWGILPVEQYLIRNWDFAAVEPPDQQRLRLIYEFLELDEIPREWVPPDEYASPPRIPTAEEINISLRPWRSDDLRQKAWRLVGADHDTPIFLRTHYNPLENSDARMKEWVNASEEFANHAWWALLEDSNSFNFGSDWRRVYEILPEVARLVRADDRYERYASPESVDRDREQFKSYLAKEKKANPDLWSNRDHFIEVAAADLLCTVAVMYMLIADQEAFDTGLLRLIYLDGKRNVIREMRVESDDQTITDIIMARFELTDPPGLEDAIIGERYRVTGDLGKELYRLTEADLADP